MNGLTSDGIPQNLTHLPMSNFKIIFYHSRSRILFGINSTSNFGSRFSFQNAHMIPIENTSLRQESHKLNWSLPSDDSRVHRKHIRFDTKITHTTQTVLSATFLTKNLRSPLPSERCSYFSFSWIYWCGSHTWIKQSMAMPLMHHLEIFFWNGKSTPLNTTH